MMDEPDALAYVGAGRRSGQLRISELRSPACSSTALDEMGAAAKCIPAECSGKKHNVYIMSRSQSRECCTRERPAPGKYQDRYATLGKSPTRICIHASSSASRSSGRVIPASWAELNILKRSNTTT